MWIVVAIGGPVMLWLMVLSASMLGRMIHFGHPTTETIEPPTNLRV
jgi:hypothetical protein